MLAVPIRGGIDLWQHSALKADDSEAWNPYPVRGPFFDVNHFGAKADNATLNTPAFTRAFAACRAAGFGYVRVPAGAYRTGRVELASGCYLLLQPHAIIQGSTEQSDYGSDWDYWSIVFGRNVSNTGVISPTADGLASGGEIRGILWQLVVGYDAQANDFKQRRWPGNEDDPCRGVCKPGNLFLQDATNITVMSVSLTESAGWTQIYRRVSNLLADRLIVRNSVQWGTGDGMDVESGSNLTFANSVMKTGDDNLAFRSGSFVYLRTPWPAGPIAPVSRVRVRNMTLTSSSSAIKFEQSVLPVAEKYEVGDIHDVCVEDVKILDTNRGIGIWQRTSHGALRDMVFRRINMTTRFDSKPGFWGAGEPLFVSSLGPMPSPLIRNLTFESISAISENGALLSSLPVEQPSAVANVSLLDVRITIQRTGNITKPKGKDYEVRAANSSGVSVSIAISVYYSSSC